MDTPAAALANRLVGNPSDAAVLEATLVGPTLRLLAPARAIAVTGADLSATLDQVPLTPGSSAYARAGSVLTFGERRTGMRAYVAVSGGIDVPSVLGSRATDMLAGFGGFGGRVLRSGDRLPLAPVARGSAAIPGRFVTAGWEPPDPLAPVRVLPGPHVAFFAPQALAALCREPWRITERADRMGYRLADGAPLAHRIEADVPSLGLPSGAIQVPADGQPIVLLADHQPTGGYTVLATVIWLDLALLAQREPGNQVRFELITFDTALALLRSARSGPSLAGDEGELAAGWA
jgi:biotin-dependent carboxylase-like uncharacterized protein